jgi:excinuclease UvrABC nuclease subunit
MKVEWSSFQLLSEETVKKHVPASAGVYLLWVKLKSGKWRCYYAGQAEDLRKRLLDHLSAGEPNDCIKNNVAKYTSGLEYARVAKQADRDGAEKFLYDHFKPECNKADPGGTPIEVNTP